MIYKNDPKSLGNRLYVYTLGMLHNLRDTVDQPIQILWFISTLLAEWKLYWKQLPKIVFN